MVPAAAALISLDQVVNTTAVVKGGSDKSGKDGEEARMPNIKVFSGECPSCLIDTMLSYVL